MTYSDRDLIIATQIAYYNFDPKVLEKHDNCLTMRELFMKDPSVLKTLKKALEESKSDLEITTAKKAIELYDEINSPDSKYGKWIIKDVKDDNSNSGLYACLIETSKDGAKDNAIVGFRGTEGGKEQFKCDVLEADLGLLNSTLTRQQSEVTRYMEFLNKNYTYSHYATSGHSLGGNLAAHAIITAPQSMQEKILRCMNADGPGFSLEYLSRHKKEIENVASKIFHKQWSLVGALLFPVPGSQFTSVKTTDDVYNKYELEMLVMKHATNFIKYDDNENMVPGDMDNFAKTIGDLSRNIDGSSEEIGNSLLFAITSFCELSSEEKTAGGAFLLTSLAAFAVAYPAVTVAGIMVVGALLVVGFINPNFFGETLIPALCSGISLAVDIIDKIIITIKDICVQALKLANVLKDVAIEIVRGIETIINGMISWFNKTFNQGYAYATSSPQIQVDTYKLWECADRLEYVKRRIKSVDRRMDALYSQVEFTGLWNLLQADSLSRNNYNLNKCIEYLRLTADDFENAERNINNSLGGY